MTCGRPPVGHSGFHTTSYFVHYLLQPNIDSLCYNETTTSCCRGDPISPTCHDVFDSAPRRKDSQLSLVDSSFPTRSRQHTLLSSLQACLATVKRTSFSLGMGKCSHSCLLANCLWRLSTRGNRLEKSTLELCSLSVVCFGAKNTQRALTLMLWLARPSRLQAPRRPIRTRAFIKECQLLAAPDLMHMHE